MKSGRKAFLLPLGDLLHYITILLFIVTLVSLLILFHHMDTIPVV